MKTYTEYLVCRLLHRKNLVVLVMVIKARFRHIFRSNKFFVGIWHIRLAYHYPAMFSTASYSPSVTGVTERRLPFCSICMPLVALVSRSSVSNTGRFNS